MSRTTRVPRAALAAVVVRALRTAPSGLSPRRSTSPRARQWRSWALRARPDTRSRVGLRPGGWARLSRREAAPLRSAACYLEVMWGAARVRQPSTRTAGRGGAAMPPPRRALPWASISAIRYVPIRCCPAQGSAPSSMHVVRTMRLARLTIPLSSSCFPAGWRHRVSYVCLQRRRRRQPRPRRSCRRRGHARRGR